MIHIHETMLSDMYKDAHGFRPRNYPEMWTKEQLEKEYEYLENLIKEKMESERTQQATALKEFEDRIAETIKLGAGTRKNAIRWLMEAEGVTVNDRLQEAEHFFWCQGLSFDMIDKYWKEISGEKI